MIKDFISSTDQDDWIDYIIEQLRGTCSNELEDFADEYREMGFKDDDLYAAIDANI